MRNAIQSLNAISVLPNVAELGYSASTTQTISGNRNRQTSGIFLSQTYLFTQVTSLLGVIRLSEFVTWAICGNKALRTNNATSLIARVEPTLHPHTVQHSLLTKQSEGISMLYKFLTLNTEAGTKRLRISVVANSLEEALSKCKFAHKPLLIARLNHRQAKGGIYA